MNAEFIFVGTEILLGNILNTNAKFLSEQCAALGVSCYYQTVVGDNKERIREAFLNARSRSDIVIFSGGLGPTEDDLTKETVARLFGLKLVTDPASLERLEKIFARFHAKMTPNNLKQADFPEGSMVIPNHRGTAPGCIVEKDGTSPPRSQFPAVDVFSSAPCAYSAKSER